MTPQLCNFDQSKALKALGYSWETKAGYAENEDGTHEEWYDREWELNRLDVYPYMADYKAPTIQDAIRWFRVEKGVHGWVESNWHFEGFRFLFCIGTSFYPWKQTVEGFKSPDEAENALLNRLIEISNQEKA